MTIQSICSCSHEAGDSDCALHPYCNNCGESLASSRLTAERDQLKAEVERLKKTEKFLRYHEIPDDAISALTKRLEADTEEHLELHSIIDDTIMNLDQLRKQRDEAREQVDQLKRDLAEALDICDDWTPSPESGPIAAEIDARIAALREKTK